MRRRPAPNKVAQLRHERAGHLGRKSPIFCLFYPDFKVTFAP